MKSRVRWAVLVVAAFSSAVAAFAQAELPAIVGDYWNWREGTTLPEGADPIVLFREKLHADGLSVHDASEAIATLRRGLVDEEGLFYDKIYAKGPEFDPAPNKLLIQAIEGREPGEALDVGMGQGRNSVLLAARGWRVTGFDPSAVGLAQARENASRAGVEITTVKLGAEYFDYGRERWDLIAILYPIEKFSVYRVRDALRPGGLVVVEAPHVETAPYPIHYQSNELLEIFNGFRILNYQDTIAEADWGLKKARLVRLIAEKPSGGSENEEP